MKKILGTVQLGMPYGINNGIQPSRTDALALLEHAYDRGIRYLDTASAYGTAMEVIGEYHRQHPDKKFKVYSKFIIQDVTSTFEKLVSEQLRILHCGHLETLYFHRFQDFVENHELVKSQEGNLDLGVSIYTTEEFKIAVQNPWIKGIQMPLSIFHHNSSLHRALQDDQNTKRINLRSVYLQGLLFLPEERLTGTLKVYVPVLKYFNKLSSELKINIQSLAAAYVMDTKAIEGILFGVEKLSQIDTNLSMLKTSTLDWEYLLKDMPHVPEALLHPGNWK